MSIKDAMSILGTLQSFNLHTMEVRNLRTLLALHIADAHKTLGIYEHRLPEQEVTRKRPVPDHILQAFLHFLHFTKDFVFSTVPMHAKNVINLKMIHPENHFLRNNKRPLKVKLFQDASDYAIGSFFTLNDQVSPLRTSHLPLSFHGDEMRLTGFNRNSTIRELYGILISLQAHLATFVKIEDLEGLIIYCDNKATIQTLVVGRGWNTQSSDIIYQIRRLISDTLKSQWKRSGNAATNTKCSTVMKALRRSFTTLHS
tara:strand:- start:469 stop:1239 length:771 start_codon:yes stop_codon:yes gene_type:complete